MVYMNNNVFSAFAVAPAITYEDKLKSTQNLKGGQKLVINANISGIPTPTAKWSHNDQPLEPSNHVTIETNSTYSKLTITEAVAENSGTYKMLAENEVGSADAEFTIDVKGVC
jgi:hypothetical protein